MASLRGQLLIASPAIVDPQFRRSVVLLAEHTDEGAMGVVLNREAEVTVGQVVPELAYLAGTDEVLHLGGPVSTSAVTVLAQWEEPDRAALLIGDDLGFVAAEVDDRDELAGLVRRARVYAGHAGWGPGQLEAEMDEESWIVDGPPRGEDVFTANADDLWADLLRRKGGEYAVVATMPDDPSLN